ncbi:MAG: 23S rRNA (adenine(2503)-C(2))-methyltransferase RlmN [Herpetosiphon sp.]
MIMKQQNDLKPNLLDLDLAGIEALLTGWGQPAFRARQIYRHFYHNLAVDWDSMTDLPLALRQRLADETRLGGLELRSEQTTDRGDTRKMAWALPGEAVIESVVMRYPDRATACVSTQAGCAMGCVFCATGTMGLLRNVSTGEIVEQVLQAQRVLRAQGSHLTNLFFMGMGEPFANYDRWWSAVERIHDPKGFNLGARSMTVSTVGLVPGIVRLAGEQIPINLAVSLHAPNDELRSALVPINRRYPLAELLAATSDYIEQTHRRVSFEYVLLRGRNDSQQLAHELASLVAGMLCHVNLIPWNPIPGTPLHRSHRQEVEAFQQVLVERGIPCTVRVERGVEIAAACGQLAALPQTMPVHSL